MTAKTDSEPSVIIKRTLCLKATLYDGGKGASDLRGRNAFGKLIHKSDLRERLECARAIGERATDDGERAVLIYHSFLNRGVSLSVL